MVVMLAPSTSPTVTLQERIAWPLMCTVQEPHTPMPHPYLVPVSLRSSRMTHSNGVSGGASAKKL